MTTPDEFRQEIINLLDKHFRYPPDAIYDWLDADNGNFGGTSPNKLIDADRGDIVLLWVQAVVLGH